MGLLTLLFLLELLLELLLFLIVDNGLDIQEIGQLKQVRSKNSD